MREGRKHSMFNNKRKKKKQKRRRNVNFRMKGPKINKHSQK